MRPSGTWGDIIRRTGILPKPLSLTLDTEEEGDTYVKRLEQMLDAGILPDTLGADMHGYNTRLPSDDAADQAHMFAGGTNFSLASAMTGLLACGVPLEKIVPMVTSHAAEMLGLADEIGNLRPGAVADVSVLADERGRWTLRDNEGTEAVADRLLRPLFCLRAGRRYDSDAPILPVARAA